MTKCKLDNHADGCGVNGELCIRSSWEYKHSKEELVHVLVLSESLRGEGVSIALLTG